MASTNNIIRNVCVIVLALSVLMPISSATVYTVGDSGGWGLGSDYSTWASGKSFVVGDSLVFNYDSSHSVAEVNSDDYNGCNAANAISSASSGATTVQLKTAGTHYFVCGVSFHCTGGMKLAVTVKPSSGAATPGSSSDGTTTTTSPAGTTPAVITNNPATPTATSHVPSSASKAVVSAGFSALFLALVVMS